MSLFDELTPGNIKKEKASVSFSVYGLMFTKTTLKLLEEPSFVSWAVDGDRKLFGIRPAKKGEKSLRFCHENKKDDFVRWNYKEIISLIEGWVGTPKGKTFKAYGEFDENDHSIVFDFSKLETVSRNRK